MQTPVVVDKHGTRSAADIMSSVSNKVRSHEVYLVKVELFDVLFPVDVANYLVARFQKDFARQRAGIRNAMAFLRARGEVSH